MFTGLVEKTGTLVSMAPRANGASVTIRHTPWESDPLALGESIAVQGVCLTVADCSRPGSFQCDVLAKTLATATLGRTKPGALLNLERATRQGDRLGGHILSGHVDGVGHLAGITRSGDDYVIHVECAAELSVGIVRKGSIAIDGISLTVADLGAHWFEVHIIPHTWQHTSLRGRESGDLVNLETDVIGKYVARYLAMSAENRPLGIDDLARAGFA